MASSIAIPASQLSSTFGCLFLAEVFASMLWSVGCLQLWMYFEKYWETDQLWFKSYILLIWLFDTAHQALLVHSNYLWFVTSISNRLELFVLQKRKSNQYSYTGSYCRYHGTKYFYSACLVHNKNIVLTGVLCASVLAQFVATIAYFSQIFNFTLLTQFVTVVHWELVMNCITAFTDTLLAVVVILLLWNRRSGFGRTDALISRLIAYTIGSSLIISLWAIVALVGAIVAPHSFIYLMADLVFPKLYFNCMLASLNARTSLRKTLENEVGGLSIRLGHLPASSGERLNISRKNGLNNQLNEATDIDLETMGGNQKGAIMETSFNTDTMAISSSNDM